MLDPADSKDDSQEPRPAASLAHEGVSAENVVHMLWIGEGGIPDFAYRCIASYPATGHRVQLWVYPQQYPNHDVLPSGVEVRDANEIIPLETALEIGYFHGVGEKLTWPSWSTFSDLFRYELLFREGGWWCDADSVAVRSLYDADFMPGAHVFATEAWRPGGYRNIILSVPKPGTPAAGSMPEFINGCTRDESKEWREARKTLATNCCVLTNSHIRAPRGSPLMRSCAEELRPLMEAYSTQCRKHRPGDETIEWALPTGGEGLRIFQEQVASRITGGAPDASEYLAATQHYAVFNPVEIDDFAGGIRVLRGERPLPAVTRTVHFFGMIRDQWKLLRFSIPNTFNIVLDDHDEQLLVDIKKIEAQRERERRRQLAAEKAERQRQSTSAHTET